KAISSNPCTFQMGSGSADEDLVRRWIDGGARRL
ncbi:MAG: hypothetical protein ACI9K5_000906, partial [Gammaproteobacteria bacterium]